MSGTVKLCAGGFVAGGELAPGTMSRAIDDALTALVPVGAGEDPAGRRKLALAIAQGVINHLAANSEAFVVTITAAGGGTVDKFAHIDKA